jgi:hypothetical protein
MLGSSIVMAGEGKTKLFDMGSYLLSFVTISSGTPPCRVLYKMYEA